LSLGHGRTFGQPLTVIAMDTLPQLRSHADVAPAPLGSKGAAFGEFLRRARERRGLTLQQIAHETKIPERHLEALEHGNLSAIPRGIYQRAEVRAFAKTVGLDQNQALTHFERALESSSEAVPATQLMDEQTQPRALAVIGMLTLAIAAISITAMLTQGLWSPASSRPVLAATFVAPATPHEFARAPGRVAVRVTWVQASPAVAGRLVITTEPVGARVTVDGVGWGLTPLTIQHLPLGDKRIRVTKDGFQSVTRLVSLGDDRPSRTIHIRLRVRQ
jgi:transcriptional regulator with XRE-family HTH domain